jgi:predicted transcriptional regulator
MRKTQKFAIVGGTVSALLIGGVAYAAWTSSGSGSGDATAGTAAGLTVHVTAATNLKPSETKTMDITVDNGNTYAVNLDSLTYNAGHSSVTGGIGSCSLTDLSNVQSIPSITDHVAGLGTSAVHTVNVTMAADASNGCQNAVFTLSFDASAHSVS